MKLLRVAIYMFDHPSKPLMVGTMIFWKPVTDCGKMSVKANDLRDRVLIYGRGALWERLRSADNDFPSQLIAIPMRRRCCGGAFVRDTKCVGSYLRC